MPHFRDFETDEVQHSWTENGTSGDNASLTVTRAAEAGRNHVVVTADFSYQASTVDGEARILFGATVIARKFIHGAGAITVGHRGRINTTANQAVSAELDAGGAPGDFGRITLSGWTTRL